MDEINDFFSKPYTPIVIAPSLKSNSCQESIPPSSAEDDRSVSSAGCSRLGTSYATQAKHVELDDVQEIEDEVDNWADEMETIDNQTFDNRYDDVFDKYHLEKASPRTTYKIDQYKRQVSLYFSLLHAVCTDYHILFVPDFAQFGRAKRDHH